MDDRLSFLQTSTEAIAQEHTFEHRQPVQGDVAIQYWSRRDASTRPPEHLLLFILGNPGLLNYYIPFLSHLHGLLPSTYAIISTSHIGHTPHVKSPSVPLDLPQQLETKVELVRALHSYLSEWSRQDTSSGPEALAPTVSLIGHSVGSWLSCETMKRLPDIVRATYMLFPTVGWISETWNGRTLWPMFNWPLRGLIPKLSPALRPILPITTFPPTTLSLLKSSETIRHALELSQSEMQVIREPDLDFFTRQSKQTTGSASSTGPDVERSGDTNNESGPGKESPDRPPKGVFGIWSAGNLDGWVGREGQMVRDALGGEVGGRVRLLPGVPHAFCLTQEHSEIVAEELARWIAPTDVDTPVREAASVDGQSAIKTAVPM